MKIANFVFQSLKQETDIQEYCHEYRGLHIHLAPRTAYNL